jgi:hypothetical protein
MVVTDVTDVFCVWRLSTQLFFSGARGHFDEFVNTTVIGGKLSGICLCNENIILRTFIEREQPVTP